MFPFIFQGFVLGFISALSMVVFLNTKTPEDLTAHPQNNGDDVTPNFPVSKQ